MSKYLIVDNKSYKSASEIRLPYESECYAIRDFVRFRLHVRCCLSHELRNSRAHGRIHAGGAHRAEWCKHVVRVSPDDSLMDGVFSACAPQIVACTARRRCAHHCIIRGEFISALSTPQQQIPR